MTNRQLFFELLSGKKVNRIPFFPDITVWYQAHRLKPGSKQEFAPGAIIPDNDFIHSLSGTMPEKFKNFTFLDFYRNFNWGCPIHIYYWYDKEYNKFTYKIQMDGKKTITTLSTPLGELQKVDMLALDGSSAPVEHLVKKN